MGPAKPAEGVPTDAPSDTSPSGSKTGRQAAWNYLVFALGKSSTLLMTVVLARLLTPADFGLFALGLLIINLFDYVKDLGVGAALVQRAESWEQLAPTGLTLSVVFGVSAGGLVAVSADATAALLGSPDLAGLVRALAVALVISACSVVPMARLRRDLTFEKRLLPEFAGAVAKTGVSIGLAVAGIGVWSLVYGQLCAVIVTTALYWRVSREPLRFGFDRETAGGLIRFGLPVTAVTLLAFAIYNVDYLAIGSRQGETELGLYTLAYRLPELVVLNLCIVVSDVLFSALSRMQDSSEDVAAQYLSTVSVVMALTAPLGIGMAVLAPEIIDVLYGPRYAAAGPVLAILALFTVVYSATFHSGDVYKAIGRPSILSRVNAAKLLVMAGPIWWAAGHGTVAVALVLLGVEIGHFCVRVLVVRAVVGLRLWNLCSTIARPLGAAVLMGAAVLGGRQLLGGLPAALQLFLLAPVLVGSYGLALRLTAEPLFRQGFNLLRTRYPGTTDHLDPYDLSSRGPRMTWHRSDRASLFVMAVAAGLGLFLGLLAAFVLSGQTRYTASATVAMLPGPKVGDDALANYWEVLNRGQATRTAATVIGQSRWLDVIGANGQELTLSAGALPDTTLIDVEVQADSAAAARKALKGVLDASLPTAAKSSGPFALNVVSSTDANITTQSPGRTQLLAVLGASGALAGGGLGLLWVRTLDRRSQRRHGDKTDPADGSAVRDENDSDAGRAGV